MKGPVKLSLAIALALAGGNAFALGLGAIQVKSGLNQPLDAEIPVISDSPAEANGLNVDLASAEDFARIGLNRSRISIPIEMAVGTNARGQTVIKLTTKEAVREPLLDFLLVANWANGKLLREYTVLLDPPITAPVRSAATVAPVAEKPAAAPQPLAEPRPAPPPKPMRETPKPPMAKTAPPKPEPRPVAAPPAPKPAPAAVAGNDYGPVAAGETLSEIARSTRPDDKTSVNQMMLALLKTNPKAFYQDNINALKRGAILRIPSGAELHAAGTLREAAQQAHSQNEAWSGKAPVSAPTLVARTGASAKPAAESTPKGEKPAKQERLALVPPSKDKNGASTDRAGAAGGTGKDTAEVKAELARTKEALTSREQESAELKSRVKQLEDIGSKDQRLISMKDSEIADLQKKLKDLQAKAAMPTPAAKPADIAAAAGKPDQKITAKDVWGDMATGDKNAKPAEATPAATPPAAASTSTPPAASATSPTAAATETSPPPTASATEPTGSQAASTGTPPVSTEPPPAAAAVEPAVPGPTATKPIKPTPPARITPLAPASEPFYKNQNVLFGGGAALLLVGLLALMRFMRKGKTVPAEGPMDDAAGAEHDDDEELRLRDALQQNPRNTAASLELLRHYYSRGDEANFEAAAENMHAHLLDTSVSEWDEVLAMGAVLAPNHPLFGEVAEPPPMDEPLIDEDLADDVAEEPGEDFTYGGHQHETVEEARTEVGTFDLEPQLEPEPVAQAPAPAHDDGFDFDLPMQSEETPPEAVVTHPAEPESMIEYVPEPAPVAGRIDDIYVGEDAIGTKLDLAKAYLDMGDPEGAKSMLDEVLSEGNDSQQEEARRLLAEIH